MDNIFAILPGIINNLLTLLGLTFLFSSTLRFLVRLPRQHYVVATGFAFGIIAIGTMFSSFEIGRGIAGDLRNVVVMSSALFGGPGAAVICVCLTALYQLYLDGYMVRAILGIFLAAGLGIVFFKFWITENSPLRQVYLPLSGLALASVDAIIPWIGLLMGSLPFDTAFYVSRTVLLSGIIIYPMGIYLFFQLVALELSRIKNESALCEANLQLTRRSTELEVVNERLKQEITERRMAENALRESEEKFRAIAEQSGEGISIASANGHYVLVNSKFCQLTGYTPEELSKMTIHNLVPKNTKISLFPKVLANQSGMREIEIIRKDGSRFFAEIGGYPLNFHGERFVLAIVRDITERKKAEKALRESEERFRNLVESSVVGIVIDHNGKPLFVNQTYANIFGYESADEIISLGSLDRLYEPTELKRIRRYRYARLQGNKDIPTRYEFQGIKKDGSLIWLEIQAQAIIWKEKKSIQSTVIDITERKSYQEQLFRQANFDDITKLPNRFLALDRLCQALFRAQRQKRKVGLLFIDLDQFKRVNDTMGHAAGDQLLKGAAQRLKHCVRGEDTVARLGGDEFTVILQDLEHTMDAEVVAKKIIEAFSQLFMIDGHEIFVTTSIGITLYPDDGDDAYALMQNADTAMYRVKDFGRNNYRFFTPELNAEAVARVALESHLRHALERGELSLHYQPLIDIRSNRLTGLEVLLRWNNAKLGVVPPDRFISVAEETGLIVPIGEWVLNAACHQAVAWQKETELPLRIAMNISSRQFLGVSLVSSVRQALEESGLRPDSLELEITESLLVEDLPNVTIMLRELHSLGVRFSVDDFGTGYSSLSYLKRFPVNTLKIDQSFIRGITTDSDDKALVEAIIAMGHSLKMEVVAEGVETIEQLNFLRARSCDLAQGYYFSRPLPIEPVSRFLQNWKVSARKSDDVD